MANCNFSLHDRRAWEKSAGMAVASRNHVGMRNSIDPQLWPSEVQDRFTLKHVGCFADVECNWEFATLSHVQVE